MKISCRYPSVELLTAVTFTLVYLHSGGVVSVFVNLIFVSSLIVITFIDLDHQIIPDAISLPGIVVGFLCSFINPYLHWIDSLIGVLVGGGSLLAVAVTYEFLTKKEGMGGGDIKLLAMIGAFLGWQAVFPVIFISSLVGTLVGVPLMLFRGSDTKLAIPFGPFLSLAAIVYLLYGAQIVDWYFSFLRS